MTRALTLTLFLATMLSSVTAGAQAPLPGEPTPSYPSAELDRIVSPIALYPDPLLAQVLAAATYPDDISEAAQWADGHSYLKGQRLIEAIGADRVPWDPSVQALLPFPSVLDMMARDMPWTQELGDAVLAERADVMDAVQRMRRQAWTYGYLRSNGSVIVNTGAYIEILPAGPDVIAVPVYDPRIVFAPPRRGFAVATAIRFGTGISLGVEFAPSGWGGARFAWPSHTVIINRTPWQRTWANRRTYVHPFDVRRYTGQRAVERHELRPKEEHERHAHR
jgi:hypothetical protein